MNRKEKENLALGGHTCIFSFDRNIACGTKNSEQKPTRKLSKGDSDHRIKVLLTDYEARSLVSYLRDIASRNYQMYYNIVMQLINKVNVISSTTMLLFCAFKMHLSINLYYCYCCHSKYVSGFRVSRRRRISTRIWQCPRRCDFVFTF